jgi:hypothetical protein
MAQKVKTEKQKIKTVDNRCNCEICGKIANITVTSQDGKIHNSCSAGCSKKILQRK